MLGLLYMLVLFAIARWGRDMGPESSTWLFVSGKCFLFDICSGHQLSGLHTAQPSAVEDCCCSCMCGRSMACTTCTVLPANYLNLSLQQ